MTKTTSKLFIVCAVGLGLVGFNQLKEGNSSRAINTENTVIVRDNSCSSTQCDRQSSKHIYLGIQLNSPEMAQLSDSIYHQVTRRGGKGKRFSIDLLDGNEANNFFSNTASRKDLRELRKHPDFDRDRQTPGLDPIPSDDEALIAGFQRAKDLIVSNGGREEFSAYIVTSGTTNPDTIAKIRYICQQLAAEGDKTGDYRLYVIGLDSSKRLSTVSALSPIAAHAVAANGEGEWEDLIKRI